MSTSAAVTLPGSRQATASDGNRGTTFGDAVISSDGDALQAPYLWPAIGRKRADDRWKGLSSFTAPSLSFAGSLFVWRPRKKPGTFRCDVCGKPFSNKANMQRHKVLHATVRDVYFCDVCSRPFSWKSSLERHKRDMHGIPGALPARGDAGGVFPDLV